MIFTKISSRNDFGAFYDVFKNIIGDAQQLQQLASRERFNPQLILLIVSFEPSNREAKRQAIFDWSLGRVRYGSRSYFIGTTSRQQ